MWLYIIKNQGSHLEYQVGFIADGVFEEIETYRDKERARRAVNYLNGGLGCKENGALVDIV